MHNEELNHAGQGCLELRPMCKLPLLNELVHISAELVVLIFEVFFGEVHKDLLHRDLVDLGVSVEPLEVLIDVSEDAGPVGGVFQLVTGLCDFLGEALNLFLVA